MLDDALDLPGTEAEIEDILGEAIVLPALAVVLGQELKLSAADRKAGSLVTQIQTAAKRRSITLPVGWKASTAIQLVSEWAEKRVTLPAAALDRANALFAAIRARFNAFDSAAPVAVPREPTGTDQ